MRLVGLGQGQSPTQPGQVRLSGTIELAKDELRTVWYEVPEAFSDGFSETANPWLVVMLPFALERGGEIHVDLPADRLLVENLRGVVATWRGWYPLSEASRDRRQTSADDIYADPLGVVFFGWD